VRRATAGSIIVHGVIVLVLVAIGRREDIAPPQADGPVDRIEAHEPERIDVALTSSPSPLPASKRGGGRAGPARAASALRSASRTDAPTQTVGELLGAATIDRLGGGGGQGTGIGGGTGIGFGDGGAIEAAPALAPPPAPKPSRARPPRLIFPTRHRDVDEDAKLFVASIVIDEDGYVVGARLVHGVGGVADEQAQQLIWRFRYEPALDDDGRSVRAQIDQSFLVQ
jgi:hypothetical protein